tara:strand:- start:1973 stop:2515 length:543 start_codon:yes stop_codon:yes gene_type:complete
LALENPISEKKIDINKIIFFIVFLSLKIIKLKRLMKLIIICNDNDYYYHFVACNTTKNCVCCFGFYVYAKLYRNFMAENKVSTLLSDVSVEGDIVEKEKIIIDGKINGDIKAQEMESHSNSNITGNIKSKSISLGGKLKGNVNSDQINIKKTADIDGVLNQKTLSIEEGATLKIKTQTYK